MPYFVIILYFRNLSYYPWTDSDQPSAGRLRIRITYHDFQTTQDYLYVPTKNKPITRDCQNSVVKIDSDLILKGQPQGLRKCEENEDQYCLYHDSDNYDIRQDCYNVDVVCGIGYVKIPVYRARNLEEVYFDGQLVKTSDFSNRESSNVEVPFLLKDHITIRNIDKYGVNYYNLNEDKVDYVDFNFDDDSSSIKNHFRVSHGSEKNAVDYYYCKEPFMTAGNALNVKDNSQNYRFYYWSMKPNEEPVLISASEEGYVRFNTNYAYLKEGIIFQSLAPGLKPTDYYAPVLLGKWNSSKFEELAPSSFNIAAKFHTPFRIFEPIFDYIKDTDSKLEDLAITFMLNGPSDLSTDEKMDALIRFSHEMYFSWPFLNRYSWKLIQARLFEKIPQMERYLINKEKEAQLKELYRGLAKNVFMSPL